MGYHIRNGQKELPFSDNDTSLDAAIAAAIPALTVREEVFDYIRTCGDRGSTDDQAEVALNISHQTCSARRRELVLAGRVMASASKRPTRTGTMAKVWIVFI